MNRSTVSVRRADPSNSQDIDAVIALLDEYSADPMGAGRPLPDAVKARLRRDLEKLPIAVILLAAIDGDDVGVAVGFTTYSTFSAGQVLNIHDLATARRARRHGVAGALLDALEQYARSIGASKLTLEVRDDNLPAQGLYRRHGISPGDPPYQFWSKCL